MSAMLPRTMMKSSTFHGSVK